MPCLARHRKVIIRLASSINIRSEAICPTLNHTPKSLSIDTLLSIKGVAPFTRHHFLCQPKENDAKERASRHCGFYTASLLQPLSLRVISGELARSVRSNTPWLHLIRSLR